MRGYRDDAVHLERPGATLYLEIVGPEDAPAVLFLHGGPGGSSHALREALGEDLEGYLMIYLDQRGGGRSYADAPFDLDTLAADVAALARDLATGPLVLFAHGFGAAVAARVERHHPEVVRGHVWLNPWVSMPTLAATLHRHALVLAGQEGASEGDPAALVDEAFRLIGAKPLLDALTFPDPASRLRMEHLDATALHGPAWSETLEEPWHVDVHPDLHAVVHGDVAALFAQGDGTATPDQAELVLGALPHALTALLPGGHHAYLDDPEAFLTAFHAAVRHACGHDAHPHDVDG